MTFLSTFGAIKAPADTVLESESLIIFLNKIISLLYTVGGLIVFVNLIVAGYKYISAEGDSNKIAQAGNTILYSVNGLILVVASFIIASVVGQIFFKDPTALTQPKFEFLP